MPDPLADQVRDLVFLFGAGASFGAGGIRPERPPLGSQLFRQLSEVYPGTWGSLPENVVSAFEEGNFENGMGLIHEQFGKAIPELMQEMAIYFIQFRPATGSSLYCRLLADLIESEALHRALFATLNYDCVLEFSLLSRDLSIDYFGDENDPAIPVWKLHGSCNFFSHGVQAGKGVSYGTGVVWQGGIQAFLDSNRVIQHCLVETSLAPVMSLYMEGKPLAVSSDFIANLQLRWEQSVLKSSAVFVIGARPWPDDTHIWGPLAETNAPLFFIGNAEEFASWEGHHRNGVSTHLASRFNTGYRDLLEKIRES